MFVSFQRFAPLPCLNYWYGLLSKWKVEQTVLSIDLVLVFYCIPFKLESIRPLFFLYKVKRAFLLLKLFAKKDIQTHVLRFARAFLELSFASDHQSGTIGFSKRFAFQ